MATSNGRAASSEWTVYNFAVLRVVPHPYVGAYVPVGVILHAPTQSFLGMRVVTDVATLAASVRDIDLELLAQYLSACEAICAGDSSAGPLALGAPSERFHWLTAPRSDVIQSGPVHEGLCEHPDQALDALFAAYVKRQTT
jgi:hypothetical protein